MELVHKDEVLEKLAAQCDRLKVEGDNAVDSFILETIAFRKTWLLDAVRAYLKKDVNKAFGFLDEGRRHGLRDEVLKFVDTDAKRTRTWLEYVAWPQKLRTVKPDERDFNKPSADYNQLEGTVTGLTDGLATIFKKYGLGQAKDAETVRKIHEAVPAAEHWTEAMNREWDRIERVKRSISDIEKQRDERLAVLAMEKVHREIDELFLGEPEVTEIVA